MFDLAQSMRVQARQTPGAQPCGMAFTVCVAAQGLGSRFPGAPLSSRVSPLAFHARPQCARAQPVACASAQPTATSAMSPRKVLVSGATGFIGRRLLEVLCSAGLQPIALARAGSETAAIEQYLDRPEFSGDAVRVAALLEPASLVSAVAGVDAVVHLAADMDFFPANAGRLLRVNVDGTRNLLDAVGCEARARGVRIPFIFASSTEAIGPTGGAGGGVFAAEDATLTPDCEYGRSKVLAEAVARERARAEDLQVCVLRYSGVYGPGENYFFRELVCMIEAGLLCVSPGPMDGRIMFSHVDDVCRATLLVLEALEAGDKLSPVYNVVPDDSVSYKDLVATIAPVVRRKPPTLSVPLKLAMGAMTVLGPIVNLGKRRVFMYHPKSLQKTVTSREYSNARIKSELGYTPAPDTLASVREVVEGEVASGRLHVSPISPLLRVSLQSLSLLLFGVTRLFLSSEDASGASLPPR